MFLKCSQGLKQTKKKKYKCYTDLLSLVFVSWLGPVPVAEFRPVSCYNGKYYHPAGAVNEVPVTKHMALFLNCQGGINLLFLFLLWQEVDVLEFQLINGSLWAERSSLPCFLIRMQCKALIGQFCCFLDGSPTGWKYWAGNVSSLLPPH